MISDEAVEAAYSAHLAHKSVRSPGNAKKAIREALEAAAPYMFRQAADYLESRMPVEEPANQSEQQYLAGYSDAVARLILNPYRSQS